MTSGSIPERVRWAVARLALHPGDLLLEIGCGRGTAVSMICEHLDTGKIVAIDRSATMIKIAQRRNEVHVASGKATFQVASLDRADLCRSFDKIFAINVNLFWLRSSARELELIKRALKPGGALYVFHEPPDASRAAAIAERVAPVLAEYGFVTSSEIATTKRSTAIVGVVARLG